MHDLVLRSSLLYVYCMILRDTGMGLYGYDGMNMETPVELERGSLDEDRVQWLR